MSGSQVSQPIFGSANQGQIATTDNAGLINNNYNQKFNTWQSNQNSTNDIIGGLFGLGAGFAKMSDMRLKRDIIRLAKTAKGYFKYAFKY